MDPHTAIGLLAARECRENQTVPMICLATAHPAKFPDAIHAAELSCDLNELALPVAMNDLFERVEKYEVLADDIETVQTYIKKCLQ